mgnify:CR=1 FL=1
MTRINIIPVSELYDQHLIAEYREITMVPAALNRTLRSKAGINKSRIALRYRLNAGHVYFFYDKGKYLDNRYSHLITEMKRRGFNCDPNRKFPKEVFVENGLYNDWSPTVEDYKVIRDRIDEKLRMRPGWYRKTLAK